MPRFNAKRIQQRTFVLKDLADRYQDQAIEMAQEALTRSDGPFAIFGLVEHGNLRMIPVLESELRANFPTVTEDYPVSAPGDILFFLNQHQRGYLRVLGYSATT